MAREGKTTSRSALIENYGLTSASQVQKGVRQLTRVAHLTIIYVMIDQALYHDTHFAVIQVLASTLLLSTSFIVQDRFAEIKLNATQALLAASIPVTLYGGGRDIRSLLTYLKSVVPW